MYIYIYIYIYIYWSNNRWAQEPIHSDVVRQPICTRNHVLSQPSQHNEWCSFQYTCLNPFGIMNRYGNPQQGRTIIQHHFSGCLPRLPLLSFGWCFTYILPRDLVTNHWERSGWSPLVGSLLSQPPEGLRFLRIIIPIFGLKINSIQNHQPVGYGSYTSSPDLYGDAILIRKFPSGWGYPKSSDNWSMFVLKQPSVTTGDPMIFTRSGDGPSWLRNPAPVDMW